MTKTEFARLANEMRASGASDDEILAEAQRRTSPDAEQTPEQSAIGKAWETARTPLTDAPSRAAQAATKATGDASGPNSTLDTIVSSIPGVNAFFRGEGAADKLRGFGQGALQGAGDLVSQMTSPLDLALTVASGGSSLATRSGWKGVSSGARAAEKVLTAPLVAEGAINAGQGLAEGDAGKAGAGALQALVAGAGMRNRPHAAAPQVAPTVAPDAVPTPPPATVPSPDVPSVQRMAGDVPPEFHAVLDGFSDPAKFVDAQASPLVDGSDFGIVSWSNPGMQLPAEENTALMQQLAAELKRRGHNPILQRGVFDGEEASYLVPGMTAQEVKELGRMGKAPQVSVISREGYHRLADDATFPSRGVAFDQTTDNYFSEIELPDGRRVKYQMDFPQEAFDAPAQPAPIAAQMPSEQLPPASALAKTGTEGPSAPGKSSTTGADILPFRQKQQPPSPEPEIPEAPADLEGRIQGILANPEIEASRQRQGWQWLSENRKTYGNQPWFKQVERMVAEGAPANDVAQFLTDVGAQRMLKSGKLPAMPFKPGKPSAETPSETGYLYHATNLDNARDIAAKSLKPHRPSHGTDQNAWPDGSRSVRSYFTRKADTAWHFAPEHGESVILRVKNNAAKFKRESTGDIYSQLPLNAKHLEILDADGNWVPLTKAFLRPE